MAPHSSILAGESHGQRSWQATVHGVAKSGARLSDCTTATMLGAIFLCLSFSTPVSNFMWVGLCLTTGAPWRSESSANPLVWQPRPALIPAVVRPSAWQPGRPPAPLCWRLPEQAPVPGRCRLCSPQVPWRALPPECFRSFLCSAKAYKSLKPQFRTREGYFPLTVA